MCPENLYLVKRDEWYYFLEKNIQPHCGISIKHRNLMKFSYVTDVLYTREKYTKPLLFSHRWFKTNGADVGCINLMQSHYNEAPWYLIVISYKTDFFFLKCKHADVQDGRYKYLRALFSNKKKRKKEEAHW